MKNRGLIRDAMMFAVKDITDRVLRETTVQSMIDDFEKQLTLTDVSISNDPAEPQNDWVRSRDFGCWIKRYTNFQPPNQYALGNKYVYWQAGADTASSCLRGSTINHWGGWSFGQNLQEALDWLQYDNNGDTAHWLSRY